MAWVGAVVGAAASLYGAQQQNSAQRSSGQVDITHSVNPYPGSQTYRDAGAAAAYNQMFGPGTGYNTTPPRGGPPPIPTPGPGAGLGGPSSPGPAPNPSPSTARNAGGQPKPPAGMRYNARGQLVRERNPAGGGGGNAPAPAPFHGQSTQTAAAVDNAMRTAGDVENGQTTQAAQDYTAGTLRGEDSNAYRSETADMIRGIDDSDYRRYLDALFAADNGVTGGAGTSSSGGNGSVGVHYVNVGGPGGAARPPGGQAPGSQDGLTGAAAELKRLMAGEDSPGAEAMRARIKRFAEEGFNEQLRQRRLEASGSGMFGGTGQLADEQFAQGRFGAGLADAYAQQDYDTYRQALGLGSAYDTAGLDRAAQERMNAANNATAGAGISAQAGAESAALASRERLARMESLGNAIGMGQNMQQFRVSGMGSLSEGFSGDQRNALNAAPDIATLGQSGWLNAGGLSLGSDQARNSWQGSQNQLAASRANSRLGQDQLAFDRERWAHDVPLTDIARYQSIVSAAYDPFSSQRDFGYDRRAGQAPYQNVAGQTLAGAAAGYSLGRDIKG